MEKEMSSEALQNIYTSDFYKSQRDDSLRSAEIIVPLILKVFPSGSVVDVGCGAGTWLSVFRACGVANIRGIDVSDLPSEEYFVDKNFIETGCDLSSDDLLLDVKSDLGICLEVGEHLPDEAAGVLVKNLVRMSPVIVFSAAFPGQTGLNHINEQPPWYWREKFHSFGYVDIDFIRPRIWADERVSWWYRQNITSFIHRDYLKDNVSARELVEKYGQQSDVHRLTPVNEWILKRQFQERDILIRDYVRKVEKISDKFNKLAKSLESMESIIVYLKKSEMTSHQSVEFGEICFMSGRMDDAEYFFKKSLLLNPENANALNNLGVLSFQNRDLAAAKVFFMNTLMLDPDNQSAKDNLSSIEQMLKSSNNPLP